MHQRDHFYITTPIFYPNADPHMGNAYVAVLADIAARYWRLRGVPTYFLTGTDENTSKVVKPAERAGLTPQEYTNNVVAVFKTFFGTLGISYDQFIRTSDAERHWKGAQEIWRRLVAAGDIYKGNYEGRYCIGCESFKTEKDLVDGKCPDHGTIPEHITEENYFFRLSKYTDAVRQLIDSGTLVVEPEVRKNEILSLLEEGLEDISFSRSKKTIPWGIPVPDDPEQTIYVWGDALTNYLTALGFGRNDDSMFRRFWPASYHVVGKDILRFHTALWPAMLLSAKIPLPERILVHGLILSGGRKMSKTLGNVLDPNHFIREYGADALRYYLSREISPFDDGEMTEVIFKEAYNSGLANGLGNTVSRVMKMATTYGVDYSDVSLENTPSLLVQDRFEEYRHHMEHMRINDAATFVWTMLGFMDAYIEETQPFKTVKEDLEQAHADVRVLVERLWEVAGLLEPFMPDTALIIQNAIKERALPPNLFVRKE